jgi:hypothetical protein
LSLYVLLHLRGHVSTSSVSWDVFEILHHQWELLKALVSKRWLLLKLLLANSGLL